MEDAKAASGGVWAKPRFMAGEDAKQWDVASFFDIPIRDNFPAEDCRVTLINERLAVNMRLVLWNGWGRSADYKLRVQFRDTANSGRVVSEDSWAFLFRSGAEGVGFSVMNAGMQLAARGLGRALRLLASGKVAPDCEVHEASRESRMHSGVVRGRPKTAEVEAPVRGKMAKGRVSAELGEAVGAEVREIGGAS